MSFSDSSGAQSRFCIDTSALLQAWQRDYPPDVFSTVWEKVSSLTDCGLLIAPEEVLLELERGGDNVYHWAKNHRSLFLAPDENTQAQVARIVNKYRAFVPTHSQDGIWADPYVIALAAAREATVVTGEVAVGPGAKRPKIPNICEELGIECTDFLGMLRSNEWRF